MPETRICRRKKEIQKVVSCISKRVEVIKTLVNSCISELDNI